MKPLAFSRGIPTKPDVERLNKAFGVPKEGDDLISYKAVEKTIGEDFGTNRWGAVTMAWRKALYRDHNVFIICEPSKGFRVASPGERIEVAASGTKSGLRKIRRCGVLAAKTDPQRLDLEESNVRDHVVRVSSALVQQAAIEARQLKLKAPSETHSKV